MSKIRLLPSHLINQIAAGEVVERPASVVKELVENALDAGADHIEVCLREGGAGYLSVTDNGVGMLPEDLRMAVERHATSKIPEDDLFHISTLGFRGEALPSIGAVSRLRIQSRPANQEDGYEILVEGGCLKEPIPVAKAPGTKVEVSDLFYAIPARLKFLRTSTTEQNYVVDVLHKLSMAYHAVSFVLKTDRKTLFQYKRQPQHKEGQLKRISEIMGEEFFANALPVEMEKEGLTLQGFIGLPTLNRSNAQLQFLFVNGRPVKDRVLTGSIRAAYHDFIAHDRHPLVCLFLTLPPREVDVNVHPAKTEVRFKDPNLVRSLMVGGLKHTLSGMAHRAANTLSDNSLKRFHLLRQEVSMEKPSAPAFSIRIPASFTKAPSYQMPLRAREHLAAQDPAEVYFAPSVRVQEKQIEGDQEVQHPLGSACAQVHETYIISQTKDGIVITDQHAAHERIIYERLKKEFHNSGVKSQLLLVPEVVKLTTKDFKSLMEQQSAFQSLGLILEDFGADSVLVREIPAILVGIEVGRLVKDLAEDIAEHGDILKMEERMYAIFSLMACHSSIRSGHRMVTAEMNALLREMENTPYAGQCNHGRPTHITLSRKDIEKLFERR